MLARLVFPRAYRPCLAIIALQISDNALMVALALTLAQGSCPMSAVARPRPAAADGHRRHRVVVVPAHWRSRRVQVVVASRNRVPLAGTGDVHLQA